MHLFKTEVKGLDGAEGVNKIGRRITSQAGRVLHRAADIQGTYTRRLKKLYVTESVNYEELDSPARRTADQEEPTLHNVLRIILSVVIGFIIACIVTLLVLGALVAAEKLQFILFHNIVQNESKPILVRYAMALAFSMGLAWAGCLLVLIYPAVGGSGLPEVLAFLNGVVVRPYLKFRVLALKSVAMILSYSSGLFLDMEAPIIHVGTLVAVTVGRVFINNPQLRRFYYRVTDSRLEKGGEAIRGAVHQDETFRVYAAAGAAVGMSVALRTPVGGVAFVLEEATSFFKPHIIIQTLYMTIVAYWILLAFLKTGNLKNISRDVLSFFYDVSCTQAFQYHHVLWDVVLGLACGILGRVIIRVYLFLQDFRKQVIRPRVLYRFLELTLLVIVTTSVCVFIPVLPGLDTCRPISSAFRSQFNRIGDLCGGYCIDKTPKYNKTCFASNLWNQCNTHTMETEISHQAMTQLFLTVFDKCDGYSGNFSYFGKGQRLSVAQQAFKDVNLNHMVVKFATPTHNSATALAHSGGDEGKPELAGANHGAPVAASDHKAGTVGIAQAHSSPPEIESGRTMISQIEKDDHQEEDEHHEATNHAAAGEKNEAEEKGEGSGHGAASEKKEESGEGTGHGAPSEKKEENGEGSGHGAPSEKNEVEEKGEEANHGTPNETNEEKPPAAQSPDTPSTRQSLEPEHSAPNNTTNPPANVAQPALGDGPTEQNPGLENSAKKLHGPPIHAALVQPGPMVDLVSEEFGFELQESPLADAKEGQQASNPIGGHTAEPGVIDGPSRIGRSAEQLGDFVALAHIAGATGVTDGLPDDLKSAVRTRRSGAAAGPPACFYELRSLLWVSSHGTIKHLFSMGVYDLFSFGSLIVFLSVYTPIAIATSGVALPAGMVVPVMLIGAAGGRLMGIGLNVLYEEVGIAPIDPGGYAILGACGLWTGVMQIPFTVCIIMFEMTGFNVTMWGPELLVVVLVSTTVSRWFGHSLYHMEMHLNHIPFLGFDAPKELGKMDIQEIASKPVISLKAVEGLQRVRKILSETTHNAYPLVDEHGVLIGLVLREELEISFLEVVRQIGGRWWDSDEPIKIHEYHHSPTTVMPTDRASHAYNMIRQLGLRYLVVVDSNHRPVGIVTRKDLQIHHGEHGHGGHGDSHGGHGNSHGGNHDEVNHDEVVRGLRHLDSLSNLSVISHIDGVESGREGKKE